MRFHRPSGGEVGGKVGRPCSESLDPPHLRADKSVRSFLFFFFFTCRASRPRCPWRATITLVWRCCWRA